jgi:hypothetical protein
MLQFDEHLKRAESVGKTLEFLLQEMGREVNTIGSKAYDAVIAGSCRADESRIGARQRTGSERRMSMAANAMPLPSGPVRSVDRTARNLFIISAPSGTGKTTLCKQLASNIPGLWHSISYTTRKPRPGEEHGREYFFADEATFQAMIDRHEFVEWARVYGHLYGTPRKTLTDKIDQGIDVLLEIDVQGAVAGQEEI